jgi:hypothetical protein
MRLIAGITEDPKQKRAVVLEDGTQFEITMEYYELQFGWFITELIYEDFTLHGLRITNQPNLLRQWKNILPFGLACRTKDDREPTLIQDFSSGQSQLIVLSEAEAQEFEDFLSE